MPRAADEAPTTPADDRGPLIAARLRQGAAAAHPTPRPLASPTAVEEWLAGDAATLTRSASLTHAPIRSHRRYAGGLVCALKRTLRRLLYPLLDMQSEVNAANARLAEFTLRQLAAQAQRIEELECRLEDLAAERRS